MAGNSGVEHLIKIAKMASKSGDVHVAAIAALGEAGGPAARSFLIDVIDDADGGSTLQIRAIAALGRASRD